MTLELLPASREHEPILADLLERYAQDFRGLTDLPRGPDGRFVYKELPLYWVEPGRHAFLVYADGLAGFALVKRGSQRSGDPRVHDMAEFFIAPEHRRRGLGTGAAHRVWARFPGPWEVRVMQANRAALAFWEHTITARIGGLPGRAEFEEHGRPWAVLSFESSP